MIKASLRTVLRDAWRLASPYFRSEQRWSARLLLGAIIAMNFVLVAINVQLNSWQGAFFNSIQSKDATAFQELLLIGHRTEDGFMPGFTILAVAYILIAIYRTYLRQWLQIRWRTWMTQHLLADWLADRVYYTISLQQGGLQQGAPDNPDQRIAEDLKSFTDDTLRLGLEFLSQVVTLISFAQILYVLSGTASLFGIPIPGYLLWIAILYAGFGTGLTHLIGRPLAAIEFLRQRVEADFRFALVRVRENAEGVALHAGEAAESQGLLARFSAIIANVRALMSRQKKVNALIAGYGQVAGIFPFIVAGPRFFSGAITFGDLTRIAGAFGSVQDALSWFITSYAELAVWRATIDRLTGFRRAVETARTLAEAGPRPQPGGQDLVLDNLTLALPDGRTLLDNAALTIQAGQATIVTGRSGSGKSSLFRAIAGIWPFGSGAISRPPGTSLFLPQRPYLPLGTLRRAVAYPGDATAIPDAAIHQALTDVGLAPLIPELDSDQPWAQRLSGGEQQRIAIARALLLKPDWLFLDEATASLDPEAEAELYSLLRTQLPTTTILSIAHRPELAQWHDQSVRLKDRTLNVLSPAERVG